MSARPRTAVGFLLAAVLVWTGAFIAAGPALAWSLTGPTLIPEAAGQVCQRCLEAASPFAAAPVDAGVPGAALLGASGLVALAVVGSLLREFVVRGPRACAVAHGACKAGTSARVHGNRVLVIEDLALYAFAVPRRCGGVVLSRGLLDALDSDAQRAVVAHEATHLRQSHHLINALATGLCAPLRWVPFIAAAEAAVRESLEIAADAGAKEEAGTAALVRALILLSQSVRDSDEMSGSFTTSVTSAHGGALFATGPRFGRNSGSRGGGRVGAPSARVRSLVAADPAPRTLPAAGLAALLVPLTVSGAGVHIAAATALVTGCAIA